MNPAARKALTIAAVAPGAIVCLIHAGRQFRYRFLFRDVRIAVFESVESKCVLELELDLNGCLNWGNDPVRILSVEEGLKWAK
jgi:hypothetical protein